MFNHRPLQLIMKNKVYRFILSFIATTLISYSYAQVIDFPDVRTGGKFKLTVAAVRFTEDSVYNTFSGKDAPNKYRSELLFGKYTFQAKIFDNTNKLVLIISKGFVAGQEPDGFLKSCDAKTNTEYYQCSKEGYSISFQRTDQYPNNWIKIHIIASLNVETGHITSKYNAFYGTGDFLYNTKTHEIKQS